MNDKTTLEGEQGESNKGVVHDNNHHNNKDNDSSVTQRSLGLKR